MHGSASAQAGLQQLGARDAAVRIARGEITSRDLVQACLDRIAERDDGIRAWAHLDPDHALEQAGRLDDFRLTGADLGPLHGVPIGVKDIIDTADHPTESGSPILAGRRPQRDASLVAQLRQAGAVILGKTVTTEFALYHPSETRNPHDVERTPGGSSSGSAAAVADFMVPAAIGSQTNGSVIRPASFCGIYGFKPTRGLVSRDGMLPLSRALDTPGVFGRSVEDLALVAQCMTGYDDRDPDMTPRARPRLLDTAQSAPPVPPDLAFVATSAWDRADDPTRAAFEELREVLGDRIAPAELPEVFDEARDWHRRVITADVAKALATWYERDAGQMSVSLREMIESGRKVSAVDYNRARDWQAILDRGLDEVFNRFDAIVTPAVPGEAPKGLETTGDPAFCTLWTFCGAPTVSLPLLVGPNGLPVGVQLVGRRGEDGRLLRTARWLVDHLATGEPS